MILQKTCLRPKKVVHRLSTFDLDFINADSKNNLFFLPFGVTSIGFISNGANASSGNILPICNDLGGKKSKYVGYVDGTASEKPEFLVIWGGGNKRGQFVRLGSRERIFLQLIHLGSDTKKTQITFKNEHGWRKILTLIPAETNTSVVRMKLKNVKKSEQ
jgi:hypothetical protein